MALLPEEIKPAMQGVIPSDVVTCARDGTPNTTAISQVYYVDADHVALSHQFFNKTVRNVRENPRAAVWLISPKTFDSWDLEVEFERSETSGPVFETMDMQVEAIASMVGMKGIFKLRAADIYRVISVTKNVDERIPLGEIAGGR
ncbi:MAG TPA: pyridoxamine 5-phosphate oxidase [Candidatus Rokubacteria bacterium]|nr:MAG: pyridoxamine 5-phosphate oxidase [Candidatus Rokubacteria bacterium GWF2_70_14]HAM56487.1 pyridoxamine 5-phosphate oxidase [Candidatus Rokubacteria bacterium]